MKIEVGVCTVSSMAIIITLHGNALISETICTETTQLTL